METVGAPALKIAPAGPGQANISWTPAMPGFVLLETWSLSPANWTNGASYWSINVDRGFTFANVNCPKVDKQVTDVRTHPPQPLYVNKNTINTKKYGTHGYPKKDLNEAFDRASSGMVDILIKPGTYNVSPRTVNTPMVLKANGGVVTVR